jgi:hypothetical protein
LELHKLEFHLLNVLGKLGNYRGNTRCNDINFNIACNFIGVNVQALAADLIADGVRVAAKPVSISKSLQQNLFGGDIFLEFDETGLVGFGVVYKEVKPTCVWSVFKLSGYYSNVLAEELRVSHYEVPHIVNLILEWGRDQLLSTDDTDHG